jgi:hypothetical protein
MTQLNSRSIHESFARFFEAPTRESLRTFLREHLGELRYCDFKEQWLDSGSLARHLLGISNAGGGCLVFGVKENLDKTTSPIGLEVLKDKAHIFGGLKGYLPESLLSKLEVADFQFEASEYPALVGKKFQVMFCDPDSLDIPFVSKKGGDGIRDGAIYTRREGVTEEASYEEVQKLLNERVLRALPSGQARHILEHLEELKILYAEIPKTVPGVLNVSGLVNLARSLQGFSTPSSPNPDFPVEDYAKFVNRLIVEKKMIIEKLIGLQ